MAKILYAEDSKSVAQYVISAFLEGHEVLHFLNGADAFSEYQKGSFDIVLTDLMMPVMDGVEFIKKVRAVDTRIPIVCVSGAADRVINDALSAGANGCVVKPGELTELPSLIVENLKKA